jgi:hypothetical protein
MDRQNNEKYTTGLIGSEALFRISKNKTFEDFKISKAAL